MAFLDRFTSESVRRRLRLALMEQRGKSTSVNSTMSSRGGRVSSKAMESPKRMVSVSAVQSTPQSVVKKQSSRVSRSLTPNAPKKGRDGENVGVSARVVNRGGLKQDSLRRCSNVEDCNGVKSELQKKLCFTEDLIKDLQSQLVALKEELQKSQSLNLELQSKNDLLVRDLAAAEAKCANASNNDQVRKEDAIVVSLKITFLFPVENLKEFQNRFQFSVGWRVQSETRKWKVAGPTIKFLSEC